MAEIGLVKFATIALQVGQAALPAYRSKFSKHQFTQPQLLAILCLMRYEAWTFREAEVRLAEHTELRTALRLPRVPDYTTVYRFLRRLSETALEDTLSAVVQRLGPQSGPQATVAVDATGLAPGAISTFFVKRAKDRGDGFTWRHWLKWTVVVDLDRRVILAQTARRGPTNDCALLRPLVSTAHARVRIGVVLADAEFDSERNHQHIRQTLQAHSVIPAKRGGANWKIQGVRAEMREDFPVDLYGRRALIERLISAVKRKLSARAPGRSLQTQCLQALLLGIAYNIYRVRRFALSQLMRMSTEPRSI
jgi:IS5 family transposase